MPFQVCRNCLEAKGYEDDQFVPTTLIKRTRPGWNQRLYIYCDVEERAVLVDCDGYKVAQFTAPSINFDGRIIKR